MKKGKGGMQKKATRFVLVECKREREREKRKRARVHEEMEATETADFEDVTVSLRPRVVCLGASPAETVEGSTTGTAEAGVGEAV